MRTILGLVLFAGLMSAAGCCWNNHPATQPSPYVGPTLSIDQLVEKINANNDKIPTLWSELDFKATVIDQKERHTGNGEGVLMYRRPSDFRLRTEELGNVIFDIGSNGKEFWLATGPQTGNTIWFGRYGETSGATGDTAIPISPALVAQVLSVGMINTNLLEPPVPVMRFDGDADAYVFLWNVPADNRWLAQREVWYDRQTLRPNRVLLYDANGRVVLRAKLGMYEQVQIEGKPRTDWPWIAGDYQIVFPDTGSTMEITLYPDGALIHKGPLPRDRNFALPTLDGFDHAHQIAGQ